MPSSILNSDDGVISGTSGLKSSGGDDGVLVFQSKGTETARIDASGNVNIGTTGVSEKLVVDGAVLSKGQLGALQASSVCLDYNASELGRIVATGPDGSTYAPIVFASTTTTNYAERARIDSSGNLLVGTTTNQDTAGEAVGIELRGATHAIVATRSGGSALLVSRRDSNGNAVSIRRDTTEVGSISVTTTAATYNTSSDYRLKHDIQPMTGALAKVAQLKPVTYKWNADDSDGEGFIAHELQEVAPYAVSGEKDGEQMQGVDYGKITPLLTAALQEAIAEIQSLKARVAELEAK
jgi:hypothetical protein